MGGFTRDDRSVHPQDPGPVRPAPRVYPYSNQAIYPVINGSNGKTFDQLMSDLGPTPGRTPAPTFPAPSAASTPTPDNPGIVGFCPRNPPVDGADWVNSLDAKAFPAQISQAAQSQLPLGITVRPTCNFVAGNAPRAIVLHYTDGSLEGAVATFQLPHNTSAHYIIGRDGTVVQLVPGGHGRVPRILL